MIPRIFVALLALAALGCEGGTGEGVEGFGTTCPFAPSAGQPCDLVDSATCFSDNSDCAISEVCVCRDGEFECEAPDWDASCADIQGAMCAIEGRWGCSGHPTSGSKFCELGAWQSVYSCSPGCPIEQDSGLPQTGESCSVAEGGVCDYDFIQCECVNDVFSCENR